MSSLLQALSAGKARLIKAGISNAEKEALWLLCEALSLDVGNIYMNMDMELTVIEADRFFEMIAKREKRVPLQYILHTQEFYGYEFWIEEGVLIPRTETEMLVSFVIAQCDGNSAYILDICCGSGAIGITIALKLPSANVVCSDISPKAVSVTEKNAQRLGVSGSLEIIKSDLFEELGGRNFNYIVSNPPYIPTGDISGLQEEVAFYEPRIALDGGEDGLNFYRKIIKDAGEYLREGGAIVLEVGTGQAEEAAKLLEDHGYAEIKAHKDDAGILRMVTARKS